MISTRKQRKPHDPFKIALAAPRRGKNLPRTASIDGETMVLDDRDTADFKAFMAEVESVLRERNGQFLTLREIKEGLGEKLIERWLIDALFFSHHVLTVEYPRFNRYTYVERITVAPRVAANGELHLRTTPGPVWPAWQEFSRS